MALLKERIVIIDDSAERIGEFEVTARFLEGGEKVHNNFIFYNEIG